MKKWIEKFKQTSTPKRVVFLSAVLYIICSLVFKFLQNGETLGQLGAGYVVTAAVVYLIKIAAVFAVAKLALLIGKKLKDRGAK